MRIAAWLIMSALALSLISPGQVRAGESRANAAPSPAPVFVVPVTIPASVAEPEPEPEPVVNPEQVYTYDQLTRDLQTLANRYPGLVRVQSLGQTAFGREIWALALGTGPAPVLINGAHHALEWLTANLTAAMADRYALTAARGESIDGVDVAQLLTQATIWFVPMVNPDGVTLVQAGADAFPPEARAELLRLNGGSSDFSRWKANAQGIDLNRQYPADWEHIAASPAGPAPANYKGGQPLAAPEARALYDFTLRIGPDVALAYHSAGRVIYWHFHTAPEHYDRDLALADELAAVTGYGLMPPEANPSGGGYKDWFVLATGRPGYTLEIGPYTDGGPLPLTAWAGEWERNRNVGLILAQAAIRLHAAGAE